MSSEVRDFRKLLISFLVILLTFVVLDFTIGCLMSSCVRKLPKSESEIARVNYSVCRAEPECVILGSSRAADHYVSSIIADSLRMSTYNAGKQGYGYLYAYAVMQQVFKRHVPRIVIIELDDKEFGRGSEPLKQLLPFWDKLEIYSLLKEEFDAVDFWMLKVNSIRYNNVVINILSGFTKPLDGNDGFVDIGNECKIIKKGVAQITPISQKSQKYINKMISLCRENNVELFFVSSPRYQIIQNQRVLNMVKKINDKNVHYLDYSQNEKFQCDSTLFYNTQHLNKRGAQLFSSIVAHDIKRKYNNALNLK